MDDFDIMISRIQVSRSPNAFLESIIRKVFSQKHIKNSKVIQYIDINKIVYIEIENYGSSIYLNKSRIYDILEQKYKLNKIEIINLVKTIIFGHFKINSHYYIFIVDGDNGCTKDYNYRQI